MLINPNSVEYKRGYLQGLLDAHYHTPLEFPVFLCEDTEAGYYTGYANVALDPDLNSVSMFMQRTYNSLVATFCLEHASHQNTNLGFCSMRIIAYSYIPSRSLVCSAEHCTRPLPKERAIPTLAIVSFKSFLSTGSDHLFDFYWKVQRLADELRLDPLGADKIQVDTRDITEREYRWRRRNLDS